MSNLICGSALKYGDNINTDIISPPPRPTWSCLLSRRPNTP